MLWCARAVKAFRTLQPPDIGFKAQGLVQRRSLGVGFDYAQACIPHHAQSRRAAKFLRERGQGLEAKITVATNADATFDMFYPPGIKPQPLSWPSLAASKEVVSDQNA